MYRRLGRDIQPREILSATVQGARSAWQALAKLEARVERRVDRFIDTGWRRLFGWLGLAVAGFSYLYAPMHGVVVEGPCYWSSSLVLAWSGHW